MFQQTIYNFIYKDDSKKVSEFITTNYPRVKLSFDKKKNELTVYSKNKAQVKTVFNILYIINRFNLQVKDEK